MLRDRRITGRLSLALGLALLTWLGQPAAPVAADPWWTDRPGQPGISNLDVYIGDTTSEALQGLIGGQLYSPIAIMAQDPALNRLFASVMIHVINDPLFGVIVALTDSLLAMGLLVAFLSLTVRRALLDPSEGVGTILGRLLLAAICINGLPLGLSWLVQASNALATIGADQVGRFFFSPAALVPDFGDSLLRLILVGLYVVLLLQTFVRLGLVNVLALVGPIALAGLVLPQTRAWAARWTRLMVATVFAQALQMLMLALALSLIAEQTGFFRHLIAVAAAYGALKAPSLLLAVAGGPAGQLALTTADSIHHLYRSLHRIQRRATSALRLPAGPPPAPDARRVPQTMLLGLLRGERWAPANAFIRGEQAWRPRAPVPTGWSIAFHDQQGTTIGWDPRQLGHVPGQGFRLRPLGSAKQTRWSASRQHWVRPMLPLRDSERLVWLADRAFALQPAHRLHHDPVTDRVSALAAPAGVNALWVDGQADCSRLVRRLSPVDLDDPTRGGVHRLSTAPALTAGQRLHRVTAPAGFVAPADQPPGTPVADTPEGSSHHAVRLEATDIVRPDGRIMGFSQTDLARLSGWSIYDRPAADGTTMRIGVDPGQPHLVDARGKVWGLPALPGQRLRQAEVLLHDERRLAYRAPDFGVVDQPGQRLFVPAAPQVLARAQLTNQSVKTIVQRDAATGGIKSVHYEIEPPRSIRSATGWPAAAASAPRQSVAPQSVLGRPANLDELPSLAGLVALPPAASLRISPVDVTAERMRLALPLTFTPYRELADEDWLTPVDRPDGVRELPVASVPTATLPYSHALQAGVRDLGRVSAFEPLPPAPPGPSPTGLPAVRRP